eukprot:g3599.t1
MPGKKKKNLPLADELPDIEDCILIKQPASPNELFEKDDIDDIQRLLLNWYDHNRRKLPWRGDKPPYIRLSKGGKSDKSIKTEVVIEKVENAEDSYQPDVSPYYTWVSEIMCQQTKVATVIEYFTRWVAKFPTIDALSKASAEDVNLLWSGLGYYRRARFLHKGAKTVMEKHNGELPKTIEGLKSIPGIGDYTAGAIGSIAYNIKTPLVDGNVIRVFSRLKSIAGNPKSKKLIKLVWDIANISVDPTRPGDFNQSLMELGATVCTPTNPQCNSCPVSNYCSAYKEKLSYDKYKRGDESGRSSSLVIDCTEDEVELKCARIRCKTVSAKYPMKKKKTPPKEQTWCVYIYRYNGKYLLIKRPSTGLLANQWEFPSIKYIASNNDKLLLNKGDDKSEKHQHTLPPYNVRQKMFDNYLKTQLSVDIENTNIFDSNVVVSRRDLGHKVHIFSHLKHNMYIEEIHIKSNPNTNYDIHGSDNDKMVHVTQLKNGQEYCWVTLNDMKVQNNDNGTIPLTTGMRKVIALSTTKVNNDINSSKKKKNKKLNKRKHHPMNISSSSSGRQPKLSNYFTTKKKKL